MESGQEFRPYIASEQNVAEFTPKAIILGVFFGIVFGAATVYLALRAGLRVSASVPIAVLSIAVFKKLGKSTILENNIVQTIGSAGESVAAGVVFTVPALLFLSSGADYFKYVTIFVLAAVGGILGVLFMIPLRRALIVKEHGKLKYPEGVACADVLIAGERGGDLAGMVFKGVAAAMLYKFSTGSSGSGTRQGRGSRRGGAGSGRDPSSHAGIPDSVHHRAPHRRGARVRRRLSWLALIPLISIFVADGRIVRT
jgi:uncharacterized oligopeptide transporter (OPT) family protein